MAEKAKYIKAEMCLKKEIAKKLNVTVRMVEKALSYDSNSSTARMIRAMALSNGAKLYEESENPYKEVTVL